MSDCIFCKIVAGEMPSYTVFEDENTMAFLDIFPVHKGHILVIPKNHAGNIFEISSEEWGQVQETVRKVAGALETSLNADGVNLMMNNREHAGQVVHHAHVHLIPRFKGDGLKLWPHGKYAEGEADGFAEKIRKSL
jgi:histidine triad (HIT) family protein